MVQSQITNKRFLVIDYETRSDVDLKKAGVHEYANHSSTQILCVGWKFGTAIELKDKPVSVWSPAFPAPYGELKKALFDPEVTLIAHNAGFEQSITRYVLSRLITNPDLKTIPISRWICTASLAAAQSLPRSLEGVCEAINLPVQKDKEGRRLVLKYCKPRRETKHNKEHWNDKIVDLDRIMEYCKADVEAEALLFLTLSPLTKKERRVWELDQLMNQRGFPVDVELIVRALDWIGLEQLKLVNELRELTDGQIQNATQRDKFLQYLWTNDCPVPNLQAKTVSDALGKHTLSDTNRRLLEIRQSLSKSSTAKYEAFEIRSRTDNWCRDNLIYHTASTGRWGGSGVQPQNFPRGSVKDTDQACEDIKDFSLEFLEALYGRPMDLFSSCLRGCVVAPDNHLLYCGDFNAIEVRVLFWLAGHAEGLKWYREDQDLYCTMGREIYGREVKNPSQEREVAKRAVLGCLAEGALVKTSSGLKKIEEVTRTDLVWGGDKWVRHGGVVQKGLKAVIRIESLNIELTPDHWILGQNMWQTAVEMDFAEDIRLRRLETPMAGLGLFRENLKAAQNVVSICAAYAELKKNVELITFGKVKIYFADNVLLPWRDDTEEILTETQISYLIQNLENVGQLVTKILNVDVRTLLVKTGLGMAVAGFQCPSHPLEHFWNTLLRCAGLMNGDSRWIELITIGVMSPEIYESWIRERIIKTEIKQTYDIQEVENGSTFSAGNTLVHNCGYGMGAKKFHATCHTFGLEISEDLAKKAVDAYRDTNFAVKIFWKKLEEGAIQAIEFPDKGARVGRLGWYMKKGTLYCQLPSSRSIAYQKPRIECVKDSFGRNRKQFTYFGVNGVTRKWEKCMAYGGLLAENVTQAVARDLMAEALLRLENAGYKCLLSVHDEALCAKETGSGNVKEFLENMQKLPDWAMGLPVKAGGWEGKRYKK